MKIEEISKTSTFAWNSDPLPLLASGTVAGAVDADFSSSSTLEIWDIFSATNSKEPIFSALVDNRFYSLAWSKPFDGRSKGLLAGAFENGTIELWDVNQLIQSKDLAKASIFKSSAHSGPVKTLQFNPSQDHVLLSGGSNGQIFVWDTKKLSEPTAPGKAMTPMDEVSCVAWNNSVGHIFASTGNSGYTSIWDLKSKREVLHLLYSGASGGANFSCVAWHPTQSTKLVTASSNDNDPLIMTWDLKNANAPEKIMRGHKKGILSLDWCKQDPEILISSGKDNSTMLWNPIKGEKLGEYPTTANWAFQTRFAPAAPDIFATASFDGKIVIQSLQDTSPPVTSKVTTKNDNDFWNEISTTETQQPVFTVHQAPSWLKRTLSVSFGFGSKLVLISTDSEKKSVIKINLVVKNSAVAESTSKFSEALKTNDFNEIIESKSSDSTSGASDKSDWEILLKLARIGKEGFLKELVPAKKETPNGEKADVDGAATKPEAEDGDNDFFDHLGESPIKSVPNFVPEGKFSIETGEQSEADKTIINLLLTNKIEDAVTACLDQNKLSAALVLALDASEEAKAKVKNAYFTKTKGDEIARLIYNVSSKNITDIVANANIKSWKQIAASIAAFSTDENDLSLKITELGDRILNSSSTPSAESRNNAMVCYLAGNAIEKIASIWLKELPEYEKSLLTAPGTDVSTPSDAHYKSLNNFMEKLSAYRAITKSTDVLGGPSVEPIGNAILEFANLVAGYGQFELAESFLNILPPDFAGLKTEKERLSGATGKKATSNIRSVTASTRGAPARPYGKSSGFSGTATPPVPTNPATQTFSPAGHVPFLGPTGASIPGQSLTPSTPSFPPALGTNAPAANRPPMPASSSIYGRPAPTTNPYATPTATPYNPYKPAAPAVPEPVAAPPPITGPPKPAYKQETEGWNDLPDTFKQKTSSRRAAPAAVVSPAASPALPAANTFVPHKRNSSAGPPPKGSRTSSRTNIPVLPSAPSPVTQAPQLNAKYAPPPSASVPLEANSGLNVSTPLAHPPAKNPYAPAASASGNAARNQYAPPAPLPSAPQPQTPKIGQSSIGSTGPSPSAPPKNPYAPSVSLVNMSPSGFVPPPSGSFGSGTALAPPPPPKTGGVVPPPALSLTQPKAREAVNATPVELTPPPTKPKYPSGDRSHISEKSIQIYTSLDSLRQAVKPKIPERFLKHGEDMEKRLNFLFDHLNNDDLLSDEAIAELKKVCSALEAKDYATASQINVDFATHHSDQTGKWYPGLKRLISMAEATL